MNDTSRRIIGLVHALNAAAGELLAAYTFDAGPNAVLYTTAAHAPRVLAALLAHFPDPRAAPPAALARGYAPYAAGGGGYVSCAATAAQAAAIVPTLTGKLACAPEAQAPVRRVRRAGGARALLMLPQHARSASSHRLPASSLSPSALRCPGCRALRLRDERGRRPAHARPRRRQPRHCRAHAEAAQRWKRRRL
jgi:hypothetical protein